METLLQEILLRILFVVAAFGIVFGLAIIPFTSPDR